MLREVLLTTPEPIGDFVDRQLGVTELVEDQDPTRLGHDLEPPRDPIGQFLWARGLREHMIHYYTTK